MSDPATIDIVAGRGEVVLGDPREVDRTAIDDGDRTTVDVRQLAQVGRLSAANRDPASLELRKRTDVDGGMIKIQTRALGGRQTAEI
ncbi:MAG: hypothetical protein AAFU85_28570, partial [Planctomycetota bacterium]